MCNRMSLQPLAHLFRGSTQDPSHVLTNLLPNLLSQTNFSWPSPETNHSTCKCTWQLATAFNLIAPQLTPTQCFCPALQTPATA